MIQFAISLISIIFFLSNNTINITSHLELTKFSNTKNYKILKYKMPKSLKPSCPSGYVLRNAYKTPSGKCTKSRCVIKTGLIRGKSSEREARSLKLSKKRSSQAMKAIRQMSMKTHTPIATKCRKGQTLRVGHRRMSYDRRTGRYGHYRHTLVAPSCITKRGKSKRTPEGEPTTRIYIDKNDHYLSEFGYVDVKNKTKEQRHEALKNLINHFIPIKGEVATYNYIIKALNARYILARNTNPRIASIFKADQKMVSKIYKSIKKQTPTT